MLWITFLHPPTYPLLGTVLSLQQTCLTHGLYGFRNYTFSLFKSSSYLKFPQTYAHFHKCYPQAIVSKEKQVGKNALSFTTCCVQIAIFYFSYPQTNYKFVLLTNVKFNSTILPWRYTFNFNVSPTFFSLYKCLRKSMEFSIFLPSISTITSYC